MAWEAFDPTFVPGGPDASDKGPSAPSVTGELPFWHPGHELFGFGVLVAITAGAMYLATERGSGAKASGEADLGPARAEGDIGIGIGEDKS